MNILSWIVDGSFSTKLTVALLHFLWQGCAGGLLVILGGWVFRSAAARFRYALNVAVLLAMAGCLPATFLLVGDLDVVADRPIDSSNRQDSQAAPSATQDAAVSTGESLLSSGSGMTESDPHIFDENHMPETDRKSPRKFPHKESRSLWFASLSSTRIANTVPILSRWIAALYLTGVALVLGRLLRGVWGGHRLRKMASAVEDAALLEMVTKLAHRLGLKVVPSVAWCEQISIPVVVGIVTPIILLPVAVVSGLTPNQLQALMLHELSHIRRFDPVINLLQRIIEAMLFFHPMVWFVSRRISIEREHAADDMVLAAGWERPMYADALVRVAELASAFAGRETGRRATVIGATGTNPSDFKVRVLRLLEVSNPPKLDITSTGLLLTIFAVVTGGVFAWSQTSGDEAPANREKPALVAPADAVAARSDDVIEIEGSVVDAQGAPVANALIVYPIGYVRGEIKPYTVKDQSDSGGKFRLIIRKADIPPDIKLGMISTIWAWAEGHAIGVAHSNYKLAVNTAQVKENRTPIVVQLPNLSPCVFVVKTDHAKPLAGALVGPASIRVPNGTDPVDGYFGLYDWLPDAFADVCKRITDANGRVVLDVVPRWQFSELEVASESHGIQSIRLAGNANEETLLMSEVGSITGRLTGGPPEMVRGLRLRFSTMDYNAEGIANVTTDENGSFIVPVIASGALRMQSSLVTKQPWKLVCSEPAVIETGRENRLDLSLVQGVPVTGRLIVRDTDNPVSGAEVSILATGSNLITNHDMCRTDERGEFLTFIVPGHDARIQVIGLLSYEELTYPEHTQLSVKIPQGVASFRLTNIEVPKAKIWNGRLVDQADRPVVGKYVEAFAGSTLLGHAARTDADGYFKLTLRDDQLPDRWSALIWWSRQKPTYGNDVHSDAEIVSPSPLQLRIKRSDGDRNPFLEQERRRIIPPDEDKNALRIQERRRLRNSVRSNEMALVDAVRDFNAENRQLERGLDQPALTEEEIITFIEQSDWKRDAQELNFPEFKVFHDVATWRRLPKDAYLQVYTEEPLETFVYRHIWHVRLMLPAIGHDGVVGTTIRNTNVSDERIDPSQVAWGKPDEDGLSLGIYLSPKKDSYAIGERVKLRLFVRNESQQAVETTWANTSHPMPEDFTVTDDKDANIAVRKGQDGNWSHHWISGFVSGGLGPGEVHAFHVPYEISFGGDGSNKSVGRVIEARSGQKLKLKIRDHNGSNRERKAGESVAESGELSFAISDAPSK